MNAELLAGVALNTLVIYVFLSLAIRLISRRQLGQLSALDLLILILLGSAVETAMVRASTSLTAGLVSASVLLVADKLLNVVMLRSKRLRHLSGPGPVILVHDGRLVSASLRRVGFTEADVLEALREREYGKIEDVRFAVLEPNGLINVVPMKSEVHRADAVLGRQATSPPPLSSNS